MTDLPKYTGPSEPLEPAAVVSLDQPLRGANFGQAFMRFWQKYATFSGRASRSEYWWWFLANIIIDFVLGAIQASFTDRPVLTGIFGLITLIPSIALGVRRLHDINRSGWWLLLALIPVIGWIILIVFAATAPKPEGVRFDKK